MHASHEALILHSPVAHPRSPSLTLVHPAREVRVLKRHGVSGGEGELGADFTSLVPPIVSNLGCTAICPVNHHNSQLRRSPLTGEPYESCAAMANREPEDPFLQVQACAGPIYPTLQSFITNASLTETSKQHSVQAALYSPPISVSALSQPQQTPQSCSSHAPSS